MNSRWVMVTREGANPLFPVEIRVLPVGGGQVRELLLTEAELKDLAKAVDLMVDDAFLMAVSHGVPTVQS